VRWGKEHLYYELCRRLRRSTGKAYGLALLAVIVLAVVIVAQKWPLLAVWALAVGITVFRLSRPYVPFTFQAFDAHWDKWCAAHGKPEGLIEPKPTAPAELVEADVGDYSFDRAVICDRPRTVDLLLANRFHFENNCAVLSADGYPKHVFGTVLTMLKRNPKLIVFVLHDASVEGCTLARRLSTDPAWFSQGTRIIDVGLTPTHARRFRGFWLPNTASKALAGSGRDAAWLASSMLELAVIRPEQVIKRLFRAISHHTDRAAQLEAGGATGADGGSGSADALVFDGGSMTHEASASDGGGDSFG
jgi:hypothetical protein